MSFAIPRTPGKTLRARLTLWVLVILTLTLALFASLLYVFLAQNLYRHHDDELAEQARVVSQALVGVELRREVMAGALASRGVAPHFVIVRDLRGEMLYGSSHLEADEPEIGRHEALTHTAARGNAQAQFFTVELDRSGPARFICVPLGQPRRAYLQVGSLLGDVATTLQSVRWMSFVLIPIVLLLTSFGGLLVAKRALSPMDRITRTLQAIQAMDLSRRLDVHPADEELAGLVRTLNQLLDRLERAFATLRAFAADTSHQLQTPLTVMKGSVEVALSQPRDAAAYRRVLEDLAEEIDDMSAILTDLQSLSLADVGLPLRAGDPVDLSETLREAAEIVRALGEAGDVAVESTIHDGIRVWGDRVRLKQVLLNLGDNAVKYTPAGGRVAVGLLAEAGHAVLQVTDTGVGIAAPHLPRIFDRFYRAEGARGGIGGTGLGLAIVKGVVEAHGGTIDVESRPGRGSRFTVRLPLVGQAQSTTGALRLLPPAAGR